MTNVICLLNKLCCFKIVQEIVTRSNDLLDNQSLHWHTFLAQQVHCGSQSSFRALHDKLDSRVLEFREFSKSPAALLPSRTNQNSLFYSQSTCIQPQKHTFIRIANETVTNNPKTNTFEKLPIFLEYSLSIFHRLTWSLEFSDWTELLHGYK